MNSERIKYNSANFVALLCAIALGIAFFVVPWVILVEDEGIKEVTGSFLLFGGGKSVEGDIFLFLQVLIPVAVGMAGFAALWGLVKSTQRSSKIIVFVAGIMGLIYYAFFFLHNSQRPIEADVLIGSGFYIGLLATLGLTLHIYIPRPVPVQSSIVTIDNVTFRHAAIGFFLVIILLPLVWVLLLSIKSRPDAYTGALFPETFDFSHYGYVLTEIETLPGNFINSIVVTGGTVIITTTSAILAGYALVHLDLRWKNVIIFFLLSSLYFPTRVVSLIAIYNLQNSLGLINSTLGLILPYVTLNLAISVLIMRSIFQQVPHELIDAARIDGAGMWRTFWRVALPLALNGVVVIIVVNFVTAWGEYLLGATLTNDQASRTMPVVLAVAQGGMGQWAWPRIAAVYVLVVTPGVVAFAFAQKLFFKGMLEGAIKA
jgi:ABC-type glycerol-3-phosphate transport system permease component